MRSLKTQNGDFLVACGKTDGVPRWAYFKESGKFIRYATQQEWDDAVKNWGIPMEKENEQKFILPSLSKWSLRNFSRSHAGDILVFWRWRFGQYRKVQQTSIMLDGKVILTKDDTGVSLTKEAVAKVNIIHKWASEGFTEFSYEDALNYGLYGGGWYMPTKLSNLCSMSNYDDSVVQRATEFIGIEKPENYSISFKQMDGENKPWAIEFSYSMPHGSGSYWLYLNGMTADAHNGILECLSNRGNSDVYKGLLWVFLNPLKEKIEEFRKNFC